MILDFGQAPDDDNARRIALPDLPVSAAAGQDTWWDSALDNVTGQMMRAQDAAARRWAIERGFLDEKILSPEDAQSRYGVPGLTFSAPLPEGTAMEYRDLALRAARRADRYARSEIGILGNLMGFTEAAAMSFTDPLAAIANTIPGVGPARYARWLDYAGNSALRRAAVRAGAGAIEGGVGAAALEPFRMAFTGLEGRDYGAADALMNILAGSAIGGGLHASVGAIGDWGAYRENPGQILRQEQADGSYERVPVAEGERPRDATLEMVRRADPATRLEAIDLALDQADHGEPVDVMPVFRRAQTAAAAATAADLERLPDIAMVRGAQAQAFTPRGRALDVTYAVAELDDLVTSHSTDLTVNPRYPAALQPRDRSRAASELQVAEIAQKLKPALLIEGASAAGGAPIVNAKGVVESGNGRVIGLRRAAAGNAENYAAYKAALGQAGYDVSGFRQPVLVRVRDTQLDGPELLAATREMNERETASMGAAEQAISDAAALTDGTLALWRGGGVDLVQNRPFVRAALDAFGGSADLARFYDRDGNLTVDGQMRVNRALIARAYGDPDLTALLVEGGAEDLKTIGGVLLDTAPAWARMRARARDGAIRPDADTTAFLVEAVHLVKRARREGRPVASIALNTDMFEGALPAETMAFLAVLHKDADLTKPASRASLQDALDFYLAEADKLVPGPSLFGDDDVIDAQALLGTVLARRSRDAGGGEPQLALTAAPARADGDQGQPGQRNAPDSGAEPAGRGGRQGDALEPAPAAAQTLPPDPETEALEIDTAAALAVTADANAALAARAAQLGVDAEQLKQLGDALSIREAALAAKGLDWNAMSSAERMRIGKLTAAAARAVAACRAAGGTQ